ncbi:tRNA uridine-5-carboxymethylaminomethyl(34) synthesis GTPase MnmE [Zhengella mangrovi]|uniref:tRNA modification GTPase MnmE n=1 Tax=Zhengella mangrovi TaxID=1982044 RepID=A0A2G1QT04_9HYPH|nr:tRNA uridine-5-carboxymethylaminomethyl(34) synthesis GTPase MnmE [Zhengella mangrovi]PHP68611.1 tRNA uridine-5-carboxymethylaminomethyl(34) synthesis GTPase MnmE [Zhengella mangrovi]
MADSDTIYALSSGGLPAGVAVVRVSGRKAHETARLMAGDLPANRLASLRQLREERRGPIDRALILRMDGPNSFTGENTIEFHLHGGKAVVSAFLDVLSEIPDYRQAEPGEFTRRAFLNGRIDLYEAESLGDLIEAETEMQRRFAVDGSMSSNAGLFTDWAAQLTECRALIEAELDFADEEDIPGSLRNQVRERLDGITKKIETELDRVHASEIVRNGYKVVLTGAPNVGKSSLLNALAERDVAIVSSEPGTTRDLVEVALDLGGYKIRLIDTAGIRETTGEVEQIGISRALEMVRTADLVLELVSPGDGAPGVKSESRSKPHLVIGTKADMGTAWPVPVDFTISVTTGAGLDRLIAAIGDHVAVEGLGSGAMPLLRRERHVSLCRTALHGLRDAAQFLDTAPELSAESLRIAANALGRITGHVDVEDLLDVIFSRFCIGK